jgi:putative FmdB family regulatory protein
MPLYEFRCPDCGIFDEWRSTIDRHNPATCGQCQQPAPKIISVPNIQLNGSLRLQKTANPEPQLVDKPPIDPQQRRKPRSHGGRPWMINH